LEVRFISFGFDRCGRIDTMMCRVQLEID
jgi:hypothetical protein